MDWVVSNLKPIAIVSLLAVAIALLPDLPRLAVGLWKWVWWIDGWRQIVLLCGVVGLGLTLTGGAVLVLSPPGGEKTIVEVPEPLPEDERPKTLREALLAEWDADAQANWPVAAVMAELSDLAYLSPYEVEPKLKAMGFESVDTVLEGSMIGYFLQVEDQAVIVFRGTDDLDDWLANLDTKIADTGSGLAHRGFYSSYQGLAPQVGELIRQSEVKRVWITGHSLGGALAVMCGFDLADRASVDIDGLITFGQPMVAKQQLADRIEDLLSGRYVHYVNQQDVVTRIPPGFVHCGSVVWYTGDEVRRSLRPMLMASAPGDATTEPEMVDEGFEPLDQGEFAQLQAKLKAEQAKPDYTEDGQPLVKGTRPSSKTTTCSTTWIGLGRLLRRQSRRSAPS